MTSHFTYNAKIQLTAPPGGVLKAIKVSFEIDPPSAGCLIYGATWDGNIGCIEVRGNGKVDLPFAHPDIYIKYIGGAQRLRVLTLGYQISTEGVAPPMPPLNESHDPG